MSLRKENGTFQTIYHIVRQIPFGRVATYGQIARLVGNPRLARIVGYAMSSCNEKDIPCHRVVNRYGALAATFGTDGPQYQRVLLESEGITVDMRNRVDLAKYQWHPNDD